MDNFNYQNTTQLNYYINKLFCQKVQMTYGIKRFTEITGNIIRSILAAELNWSSDVLYG